VDPERFPNGIKPLADLVRSHGMKFCNWLDPEEAHPTSELAREHPEWMLYIDDKVMGLVDFGLLEVQDYFIEFISQRVQDWGIHKLKWDNNINPKPYWEVYESRGQTGWMQIRHIRGVYRVWEELMKRNPDLILENCSSGGRRLDLGTFARAHIHHGSDFNFHTDIIRTQISGANTVMPTHRVIHTCTWGGPDSPDTYFQSRFGGILRFSQDFASWPVDALKRVKKHIDVYKTIRHLLNKSFYPLFPQPLKRDWDGWQYHDHEKNEGFLLVFRMKGEPRGPVRLHDLENGAMYELHDPYMDDIPAQLSGRELRESGIDLLPEKDSTKLIMYKSINEGKS
jgi:alpha-galactosidase